MLRLGLMLVASAVAGLMIGTKGASARVEAGSLTCDVGRGVALILSTPRKLHCVFHRGDGLTEAYEGRLRAAGLDAGVSGRGVIAWGVLAASTDVPPGELGGHYVGIEAGAAAIVGGRGQVLVGGSNKTIMLQPISVEAEVGLNVAVGITAMSLHPLFQVSGRAPAAKVSSVGHPANLVPAVVRHPHYGCGSYVTMTAGQTLSGYAHACGVSLEALLDANPQITNVRDISVGTPIHIPTHVNGQDSTCGARAILGENESLDHLAWRCGVTLSALIDANPDIRNLSLLQPGLVLAIPALQPAPRGAPVAYAATEVDAAAIPGVPTASQPPAGGSPAANARLEVICITEATHRYGLQVGDVTATGSVAANGDTYSVALRASNQDAVCLVDQSGQVLFVSEIVSDDATPTPAPAPQPTPSGPMADIAATLTEDETLLETSVQDGEETHESGRVDGYRANVYAIDLDAGDDLRVEMRTENDSAYFNIVDATDTSGAALFRGETSPENVAMFEAPHDGVYLIKPFLVRAAARRGETADYLFVLTTDGAGGAAADGVGEAVAGDQAIPQFDATGTLDCAVGRAAFAPNCPFGVMRGDPGTETGTIYVSSPKGGLRTLLFGENGVTTKPDGAVNANRDGDTWTVNVDGDEVYQIPDVVIAGD